jgi:hypothetical protein
LLYKSKTSYIYKRREYVVNSNSSNVLLKRKTQVEKHNKTGAELFRPCDGVAHGRAPVKCLGAGAFVGLRLVSHDELNGRKIFRVIASNTVLDYDLKRQRSD